MRCSSCQAEISAQAKYCSECGYHVGSGTTSASPASGSGLAVQEELTLGGKEGTLKPPSGFGRTLSTDLVARQIELRTLAKLSTLIQSQSYQPGEVMIRQGELKRDLFFLSKGVVQISRRQGDGDLVLNEIEPPYILGDVAFLFGIPRTATATAKTEVKTFVLKHEDLKELLRELPPWVQSLLTALATDIKSLHHKTKTLEKKLIQAEPQTGHRAWGWLFKKAGISKRHG